MPVPALITDLSTTAASNSPAGTETPADGDNYFRAHASFIAQLRDQLSGASPITALTVTTFTVTTLNGTTLNISGNTALTGTLGVTGLTTLVDLTTTGNTILGNAQADTLNVGAGDIIKDSSGRVGLGITPSGTWRLSVALGAGSQVRWAQSGSVALQDFADLAGTGWVSQITRALDHEWRTSNDSTKALTLSAAGLVNATAGSGSFRVGGHITRFESITVAVPTSAGTGSLTTIAHGGTRVPDQWSVRLRCVTTEHGYAVGAEVDLVSIGGSVTYSTSADATNIYFRMPAAAGTTPQIYLASGANSQPSVTAANWRLAVRAVWL